MAPLQTGEEVCEGHGFDGWQCVRMGCCYYNDFECKSAIGNDVCLPQRTGEDLCESPNGFDQDQCESFAVCDWDNIYTGDELECVSIIASDVWTPSDDARDVCENKGFDQNQCESIGCCQFDDVLGECQAAGRGACSPERNGVDVCETSDFT